MNTQTRPQSPPLEGTASAAGAIARVSYTHDAVIDMIIARPEMGQGDLAKHFGYTQAWLSRIMNSDAFLARLAQRKGDIVDPALTLSVEEKLGAIASLSADIVLDKLAQSRSADMAFKGLELAGKLKGYGARQTGPLVQNNFVVALPPKVESESAWAAQFGQQQRSTAPIAEIIDMKSEQDAA